MYTLNLYYALILSLGNGGNAGFIGVRVRKITGQMGLRACRGTGADPAENGKGGRGEIEMSIVFLNTILIPILIRYSYDTQGSV